MSKNDNLVSIIIPVYNVYKYVEECLESVISQSYKNMEIIVVDDGSTDGSGDLCDSIAMRDSRIRVVHKNNGGLSDARNVGIEKSKGEYIAFVDSDDWISYKMIEQLLQACMDNDTQIAVGGMQRVYKNRKEDCLPGRNIVLSQSDAITELFKGEMFGDQACTKIFKKELFRSIRYPVEKQFEDIYTTYKLFIEAQKVTVINQALYFYRQRSSSITAKSFNMKKLDIISAIDSIKNDKNISQNARWIDILNMRLYDAYGWTLLDMFQSKDYSKELLAIERELFYKFKKGRKQILKKSRYTSCKMIALLSYLGFKICRNVASSSCVAKRIESKNQYYE